MRLPSSAVAGWLIAAATSLPMVSCSTPDTERFGLIRPGMTQTEVAEILGEPSSRTRVPPDRLPSMGYAQRWQYGDSLSSLASGAVFTDAPDDRVFAVFFDADGRVVRTQEPLSGPRPMSAESLDARWR